MIGKKGINKYYQLKEENYEEFQELAQCPNYETILKCLIEGRVSWKCNKNGQILFFQAKGLSYMGKQWNHFIIAKIILSGNISKKKGLYIFMLLWKT